VLKEADAGVLVPAEDPGALLDAIIGLRNDPSRRQNLGANGRAFAQRFWERQRTLSGLESSLLQIANMESGVGPKSIVNEPLIVKTEESAQ